MITSYATKSIIDSINADKNIHICENVMRSRRIRRASELKKKKKLEKSEKSKKSRKKNGAAIKTESYDAINTFVDHSAFVAMIIFSFSVFSILFSVNTSDFDKI